jgi:L-histidine Nalpha-methyltransferase
MKKVIQKSGAGLAEDLAAEVKRGLSAEPKTLAPWLFYDALGSRLFDAICELPWYPITRAELGLLRRHAGEMMEAAGSPAALVELGPGSGEKMGVFLDALPAKAQPFEVHLIDVSKAALDVAGSRLREGRPQDVHCWEATFDAGLARLGDAEDDDGRLVFFLGSNIGNFSPREAVAFLSSVVACLGADDGLLLGVDLVKESRLLELAYDDPLGVTAAFNKNVLQRINRELGADFDLLTFTHVAEWNAEHSRIEAHLRSERKQEVRIPGAERVVSFDAGETIWTESSYKFTPEGIDALAAEAGLRPVGRWVDEKAGFMNAVYTRGDRD